MIVVSSVSCIYGLGEPEDFAKMMVSLRAGMVMPRDVLLKRLVEIRYERNDIAFERNMFRVRGGHGGDLPRLLEATHAIRVEFLRGRDRPHFSEVNAVTGAPIRRARPTCPCGRATHYVTPKEKMDAAIRRDLQGAGGAGGLSSTPGRCSWWRPSGIKQRAMYDIEMMQELGYCLGHRELLPGHRGPARGLRRPHTLLDYFPKDFLHVHRREPRDPAPGAGHVQRRPGPQDHPGWTTASACPARSTTGR